MNPSPSHKPHTLDIRPLMAKGEMPLPRILKALDSLPSGEVLALITPFLPSPLIEKLQSEGFEARPERRSDGSWLTRFWRA